MKIRIPRLSIINKTLLITLFTSNSVWAHSSGGHIHSWYGLDHIIIALGICCSTFLLYKIILFYLKTRKADNQKNLPGASKKTTAYK